jgi:hypothetical protein
MFYEIENWDMFCNFWDELRITLYVLWIMKFVVEQCISCLQIVWKIYDVKWCVSMWKHGHYDYMTRTHRAWCETKTRTWNAKLSSFGWESHRHQAIRPFE